MQVYFYAESSSGGRLLIDEMGNGVMNPYCPEEQTVCSRAIRERAVELARVSGRRIVAEEWQREITLGGKSSEKRDVGLASVEPDGPPTGRTDEEYHHPTPTLTICGKQPQARGVTEALKLGARITALNLLCRGWANSQGSGEYIPLTRSTVRMPNGEVLDFEETHQFAFQSALPFARDDGAEIVGTSVLDPGHEVLDYKI